MSQARQIFARICVEIDLQKPLVPMVHILGHGQTIKYEDLHMICFECGPVQPSVRSVPEETAASHDRRLGLMAPTEHSQQNQRYNYEEATFGPYRRRNFGNRTQRQTENERRENLTIHKHTTVQSNLSDGDVMGVNPNMWT